MGNTFSKRFTLKDKLLKYEDEIKRTEGALASLQSHSTSFSSIIKSITIIMILSLLVHLSGVHAGLASMAVLAFYIIFYMLAGCMRRRRITCAKHRLDTMKSKQKELIAQYKKDNNFTFAKSLIDKYEEEESRESFLKQVQKKKRDAMDKIADYVLANDPSKMNALICKGCGLHNGLLDPANNSIKFFYCYSCGTKNERGC